MCLNYYLKISAVYFFLKAQNENAFFAHQQPFLLDIREPFLFYIVKNILSLQSTLIYECDVFYIICICFLIKSKCVYW